jgi:putative membrane protein
LAGLTCALLTLVLLLTLDISWGVWDRGARHPGWLLLGVIAAYLTGSYAGSFPPFVRFFVPAERMSFKVRRRAELAFYEHGLHKTRDGTGILIMVSLLERRVQVLADKAIHDRVPPGTWDKLVQDLIQGVTEGRPTDALCRAIEQCGNLLAEHFPIQPGDNPDELADDLIQEK